MTIEILDPTHESGAAPFQLAARLPGLTGRRIGIVSNGKKGTQPFFQSLADALLQNHGAAEVAVRIKDNYSAPANAAIMKEAQSWDAVISGIGD